MIQLRKNPYFIIGCTIILIELLASFYHFYFMNNKIPQTSFLFGDNGATLKDAPPYSPSVKFWFGSDEEGYDYFYKIISGAKYTILLAFLIASLRILIAALFSIFLIHYNKITQYIRVAVNSVHFIPASLLAYFLLQSITSGSNSFTEKAIFEIIILVFIAVPILSMLISDETNLLYQEDYIEGAKILGGNKLHIYKVHIIPHLIPRFLIYFIEQVIQVLLIMAHLGLFEIFFGGTRFVSVDVMGTEHFSLSLSNEWSGLIGIYYDKLRSSPWLLLIPITFFMVTIFALNMILEGIKQSTNINTIISKNHKINCQQVQDGYVITEKSFQSIIK